MSSRPYNKEKIIINGKGMTRQEIAKAYGVSETYIYALCHSGRLEELIRTGKLGEHIMRKRSVLYAQCSKFTILRRGFPYPL